ncbi:hypothetical protein QUC31_013735 [Theobroma cacao]
MVPTKESLIKKMLKRVRAEDGECVQNGGEHIKRRRVERENCVFRGQSESENFSKLVLDTLHQYLIADFHPLLSVSLFQQVIPWGDLDSLAMLQRPLDVDILVTGRTYQFKAYKHEGGVVINPGSATVAYSSFTYDVKPSFAFMDIDGLSIGVYVYELIDKIDFKKTATSGSARNLLL